MNREEEKLDAYHRTAGIFTAVVVIFLSFLIVRPFMVAILSAAALAYIFYPLYLKLLGYLPKKTVSDSLSAFFICLLIVILVLIPVIFIAIVLNYELKSGYTFMQNFMATSKQTIANLPPYLKQWLDYLPQFSDITSEVGNQLFDLLQHVVKKIPNLALNIFVTVFSCFYFLKRGEDIYKFFSGFLSISANRSEQILRRFDDLSRGMVMGQIVVGIIQGILAWLGFYLLGVPNPVLWGTLTAIISIVPLLGAVIVWLPIVAYLAILGSINGEYWRAITLFIYGVSVVSAIDNILKPKIIGQRANIHPLIILLGILGGIQLFGIPGLLIGPLILTIFDIVIEIYKESL